jgi:Outer membrane protein beta-barrel domain
MKKLIVLSLVALSTLTVNAQRKKTRANTSQGNWALRVGAGFNTTSNDEVGTNAIIKNTKISVMPSIGYFIADNLEIGLNIGISNDKNTNTDINSIISSATTNMLNASVYGMKYFPINNWFAVTGAVELGLGNGEVKTQVNNFSPVSNTRNEFGGAANLGMAFTPVNNLAIQANIISLGAVSGTESKVAPERDSNYSNFGLNVWRSPMSVSLVYYFGRGMSND